MNICDVLILKLLSFMQYGMRYSFSETGFEYVHVAFINVCVHFKRFEYELLAIFRA